MPPASLGRISHLPHFVLDHAAQVPPACRPRCRRCRISSHGRCSAGRTLRSAQKTARRRGGRSALQQANAALSIAKATRSSPSKRTRTGGQSGSGISAGEQRRYPVAAHQLAHRLVRTHEGEHVVFFALLAWLGPLWFAEWRLADFRNSPGAISTMRFFAGSRIVPMGFRPAAMASMESL